MTQPPPSVLVVGAESAVAEELLVNGLQQGFRVHTVRTTTEAMSALGQVLFDLVVFNPFSCPDLPRLVSIDPDLARVPFLGVVPSSWDDSKPAPETTALVFEQGQELVRAIGFVLKRRPPSEPNDISPMLAQIDSAGGSFSMRLIEVRVRHLRVGSATLPAAGTSVAVKLPWSDVVRKGSIAIADTRSGLATIALWQD